MVKEIVDSFEYKNFAPGIDLREENTRYVTFKFKTDNQNDMRIRDLIEEILFTEQDVCMACVYFEKEVDCFMCKKNGCLTDIHNKYNDLDGSKCDSFKRRRNRMNDLIDRAVAINALWQAEKDLPYYDSAQVAVNVIKALPSAQPECDHTMEEFMYGQDMGNPEDGSL